MSEIIQLIRDENNERLGSNFLSNKNDLWNSTLSKTCVFIGSFSINDIAIFGCVIDRQYDSLSDLISFDKKMFAKYGSLYSKYVHNMR